MSYGGFRSKWSPGGRSRCTVMLKWIISVMDVKSGEWRRVASLDLFYGLRLASTVRCVNEKLFFKPTQSSELYSSIRRCRWTGMYG